MCEVRFRAPRPPHATQLLKQQQHVAWKLFLWSWTSCCPWDFDYAPLSAADNISRQVGPRSGLTKSLNVFIHNKGADLRFCWSRTTKSGYIHLQTCGKIFYNICRNYFPIFCEKAKWKKKPSFVKLLSWKTFPSKKIYGLTVYEN